MKLHLLNVVKGSRMALDYSEYQPFASIEEYVNLVVECLELIPPQVTIHRLTGDGPKRTLLAPLWTADKKRVLNELNRTLENRKISQGSAKKTLD